MRCPIIMADGVDQCINQLSLSVRKNFKEFKDAGHLVDFTIVVEDKEFKIHRIVLAASSLYFRTLFLQSSAIEVQESRVRLEDISCSTIEAILDYCYTLELALNFDNVREILCAANRLQIIGIQTLAVEFLCNGIDYSNCLGIYSLAKQLSIPNLMHFSLEFCLNNFRNVINQEEFLEVDDACLLDLISHDQLDVDDEELVFHSVMNWARVDIDNRKQSLKELMSHVRFATIEPSRLVFLNKDLSIYFQEYIDQAKDFLLLNLSNPKLIPKLGLDEHRTRLRNSLRRQQRIFAVGGWTAEYRPFEKVEKYDPYSDTWVEISSMTKPRCGVGAAILGDSLYAIGGHDGHAYLNSVERYDIQNDKWYKDVASMKAEKTSFGVVTFGDHIYAIGGQVGSHASDIVDKYDVKTNTWKKCAPLMRKRLGAGVAVLDGYIYAVGGSDGNHTALNSVERYDPEKDEWTPVASMKTHRKHFGCEVCDGKLYAVGGRGSNSELETGECYDPKLNTWTEIAPMFEKRSGNGLVELDGLLYAIGGHNGDLRLKSVDAYDKETNTWTKKKPMSYERLGAGVVVYSKVKRSD